MVTLFEHKVWHACSPKVFILYIRLYVSRYASLIANTDVVKQDNFEKHNEISYAAASSSLAALNLTQFSFTCAAFFPDRGTSSKGNGLGLLINCGV